MLNICSSKSCDTISFVKLLSDKQCQYVYEKPSVSCIFTEQLKQEAMFCSVTEHNMTLSFQTSEGEKNKAKKQTSVSITEQSTTSYVSRN